MTSRGPRIASRATRKSGSFSSRRKRSRSTSLRRTTTPTAGRIRACKTCGRRAVPRHMTAATHPTTTQRISIAELKELATRKGLSEEEIEGNKRRKPTWTDATQAAGSGEADEEEEKAKRIECNGKSKLRWEFCDIYSQPCDTHSRKRCDECHPGRCGHDKQDPDLAGSRRVTATVRTGSSRFKLCERSCLPTKRRALVPAWPCVATRPLVVVSSAGGWVC